MDSPIIRVRGLPYSATPDDLMKFFNDVKIKDGKRGISFPQGPNGRSNGEAFIVLESEFDIEAAMAHHKEHMGRRYIEVFNSDEAEMKRAMGWQPNRNRKDYVARLRGLPYDTDKMELYSFFSGLEIAPNGIGLLVDHMGRCTGEAFIQFTSADMLARAKEKHLEKIGHRYIEIFDSTGVEANMAIRKQIEMNQERGGGPMLGRSRSRFSGAYGPPSPIPRGYGGPPAVRGPPVYGRPPRPGPYSRPYMDGSDSYDQRPPSPRRSFGPPMDNFGPMMNFDSDSNSVTGHSIRMRGLPYSIIPEEIARFLAPLKPVNINIGYIRPGRPSGEARVDFASHDEAKEAMKKDREKIGQRYIELFLESTPMGNRRQMKQQSPVNFGSRPSGPPFYPGGVENGTRFNGTIPPKSRETYLEPRNDEIFGAQDDYNYPSDDRYGIRRDVYNGPPEMRRPSGVGNDGFGVYRERMGDYGW